MLYAQEASTECLHHPFFLFHESSVSLMCRSRHGTATTAGHVLAPKEFISFQSILKACAYGARDHDTPRKLYSCVIMMLKISWDPLALLFQSMP